MPPSYTTHMTSEATTWAQAAMLAPLAALAHEAGWLAPPAFRMSAALCRRVLYGRASLSRPESPNQVTFAGLLLTIAAFYLFWTGQFGWGLVAAWIMTFLDTVDGKLARVTLTSSKIGNVFDHGIDLIHPPFWW